MTNHTVLWEPSQEFSDTSNLKSFQSWLKENRNLEFEDYNSLWNWSVDSIDDFWSSILDFFDLDYDGEYSKVHSQVEEMHKTRWFEGISLCYSEHVFKNYSENQPAIISRIEGSSTRAVTWKELRDSVAKVAHSLKTKGVVKGDRVCCVLPNCPEALISFLAVNSLGAVWSSCAPDFGIAGIIDRFIQIEPKIFITCNGYKFNGQSISIEEKNNQIIDRLSSIEHCVIVNIQTEIDDYSNENCTSWKEIITQSSQELTFSRVEFSHPIWVLYSSGTTGKPKAITHSNGGILIEHFKALGLHQNIKKGDRFFWNSNIGWMMWNYANSALLVGGVLVMYDGSPVFPSTSSLWDFALNAEVNHFGSSAVFYNFCRRIKLNLREKKGIGCIKSICSTGSPLNSESFDWIYKGVKDDVWLVSLSGGTDICSGFVGGNPMGEVNKGQIQCRMLGVKLESYSQEGISVVNQTGEMVIEQPMPSMPLYFWGDEDNLVYKSSYFEEYPGKWRHGDFIKVFDNGGVEILGRSDATLNRGGVRIGTSEIYSSTDNLKEIEDSLIVCLEKKRGQQLILFVKMKKGCSLTKQIVTKLKHQLKTDYSSFHVPDSVLEVTDIPYTISGKKMEIPIKKLLSGIPEGKAVSLGAMKNPEIIKEFDDLLKNNLV